MSTICNIEIIFQRTIVRLNNTLVYAPFSDTHKYAHKSRNDKTGGCVEAQTRKKHMLPAEADMEVVFPAVHLHDGRRRSWGENERNVGL